jgi:hypothetical protein
LLIFRAGSPEKSFAKIATPLKDLSPETADWMLHMNKVFGQHKYINTEINGTVLLDKGIQDGVRDMTVPKSRGWG